MSTKRRTIIISVEDQYSRPLLQYAKAMYGAEEATRKFSATAGGQRGSLGQMAFSFNQIYESAQKVYGTFNQVFSTANEWARMGVNAERSRMALEAYAGSAQEAEKWIRAVTDASRGSMTEGAAAAQAFQLMKFGLADTAEAAGQFVRDISIVSAINPQLGDTATAIQQLQLTMANMSYMRLDQLGISVATVKKRIDELRASTKDLSQEEAFNIAVMEEIHAQAETVGDGILTLTQNQDKLKARWGGFKEWAGLHISSGFEGAATAVESFIVALENDLLTEFAGEFAMQVIIQPVIDTPIFKAGAEWLEGVLNPGGATAEDNMPEKTNVPGMMGYYMDLSEGAATYVQELENAHTLYRLLQQFPEAPIEGFLDPALFEGTAPWTELGYESAEAFLQGFYQYASATDFFEAAFRGEIGQLYATTSEGIFSAADMAATRSSGRRGVPGWTPPQFSRFATEREVDPGLFGYLGTQLNPAARTGPSQARTMQWFRERDFTSLFQNWAREQTLMGRQGFYQTDFFSRLGRSGSQKWLQGAPGYGPFDFLSDSWTQQRGETAFDSKEAWRQQRGPEVANAILEKFQVVPKIAGILLDGAEALEQAAVKYASLNEKFGIDTEGKGFEVDVLGEMRDALGDVEIDAERAAEGVKAYEWAVGLATGSSEAFDARLEYLTRHFAEGYLNAEEYAEAVRKLSQLDFSWIDRVTESMSYSEGQSFVDKLMGLTTVGFRAMSGIAGKASDWGGQLQGAVSDPFGTLRGLAGGFLGQFEGGGTAGAAESPLSGLITDHERLATMLQENNEATKNWFETQRDYHEMAAETTTTMADAMIEDIMRVEPVINSLVGPYAALIQIAGWSGWASVMGSKLAAASGGGGGGGTGGSRGSGRSGVPEFAVGGYTGDGGRGDFAGLVHKGEYVVPAGGALVLRGGGAGRGRGEASEPIQVQLMLDKRVIHEAVIDVDRQKAGTRRSMTA